MKTQELVSVEACQKMLLVELAVYFPCTSFFVTSEKQGNGILLVLSYEDGPRKTEVRRIAKTFEHYSSNGDKSISIDVVRRMSSKTEQFLADETRHLLGIERTLSKSDFLPVFNKTVGEYIQQIFCVMAF